MGSKPQTLLLYYSLTLTQAGGWCLGSAGSSNASSHLQRSRSLSNKEEESTFACLSLSQSWLSLKKSNHKIGFPMRNWRLKEVEGSARPSVSAAELIAYEILGFCLAQVRMQVVKARLRKPAAGQAPPSILSSVPIVGSLASLSKVSPSHTCSLSPICRVGIIPAPSAASGFL